MNFPEGESLPLTSAEVAGSPLLQETPQRSI